MLPEALLLGAGSPDAFTLRATRLTPSVGLATVPSQVDASSDRPSIAVLPFANMSGDPEQEYFADGMVEDILTALSHVRWLFVIARQSSFSYKGRAVDVRQIGRELGVRYVVEGSVRKSGNRVRIAAQLIDAETDAHIWAERYDRDMRTSSPCRTKSRSGSSAPSSLRFGQLKSNARLPSRPAVSPPTTPICVRSRTITRRPERQSLAPKAVAEAIDLDPGYAEALGTLADCIAIRISTGWHESRRRENR